MDMIVAFIMKFFFLRQIDIFYTMSIVGTLCFPGDDMDVTNDTSHFFEAISEIQPTVFFGPPSTYERIYHHFREMKKHTSGENTYLFIYKILRMLIFRGAGEAGSNWAER